MSFKKQQGNTYITVLISLIIIEFVVLTMLSAIMVSTQANIINQETTIAYRVAESYMEKELLLARQEIASKPNVPVSASCSRNQEVVVSEKQKVIINRSPVNNHLCRVEITVDYIVPLLNRNVADDKRIVIESLVTRR